MTVGERIKERRTLLKLNQEELAKKAGYKDKTAISKLENAGNNITMKQVNRVAAALNVTSQYLMGWETNKDIGYLRVCAQEIFKSDIGEIIDRKDAIRESDRLSSVIAQDNFLSDQQFFDKVDSYYKYKFMVHLWDILFDEKIITQNNYFNNWKLHMIDKDFTPIPLLQNDAVCNYVRKHFNLPLAKPVPLYYDEIYTTKNRQYDVIVEKMELLNDDGYEKLSNYINDLLKIYQYLK